MTLSRLIMCILRQKFSWIEWKVFIRDFLSYVPKYLMLDPKKAELSSVNLLKENYPCIYMLLVLKKSSKFSKRLRRRIFSFGSKNLRLDQVLTFKLYWFSIEYDYKIVSRFPNNNFLMLILTKCWNVRNEIWRWRYNS